MAGRIQVATRGTQDVFFTDNPEYTYFIKNFKKHTNFARYTMEHDVTGELEFGQTLRCTIPQNAGDLLKAVRLHVVLKGASPRGYVESIGHAMIEHVDLLIGGTLIQRIPRDWLQIHSEHYVTQTKQVNLSKLIGKPPYEFSGTPVQDAASRPYEPPTENDTILSYLAPETGDRTCIIDLPFYFHGNPELALPLCAITQQECEIVIQLSSNEKCTYDTDSGVATVSPTTQKGLIKSFSVHTELVALDEPERIKYQEVPTDFIITQVQSDVSIIPAGASVHDQKLEFVNPVKELYFVIQRVGPNVSLFDYDSSYSIYASVYVNYENLKNLRLRLDDSEIIDEVTGNVIHLRAIQSGIHHSRTQLFRRFYSYSFALEPERWYPTGQRNFSLVKEQHVKLSVNGEDTDRELRVYALSYNILRIENGTARLLFQSGPIGN